jgi:hypothetical protein
MNAKAPNLERLQSGRSVSILPDLHSPKGLLVQTGALLVATFALLCLLKPLVLHSVEGRLSLMGAPIRSFDFLQDGAMTYAIVLGTLPGDGKESLAYLESDDRGQTFGSPSLIDLHDEVVISNRANSIRLTKKGSLLMVVYQVKGQFPGNGPLRVAVSKDKGAHWISGIQPVTGDAQENQSYPVVKSDEQGNAHLFWLDDRDEAGDTVGLRSATSHDGGLTWQQEVTLDDRVCTCCSLQVAELPKSRLAVLYRDHSPKDMRLGILDAAHAQWTQKPRVGAYGWGFEGCPHMGGGLQGQWIKDDFVLHAAVWTGADSNQGIHYLRSRDLGSSWSDDLLIDEVGGDPELVTADGARLAIAYRQGIGLGARIIVRVSHDAGLHWASPRVFGSPGLKMERPKLIADATGYTVLWTETSEANARRLRLHSASWKDSQ